MSWWMIHEFWWLAIGSVILMLEVFVPKKDGVRPLGSFSLLLLFVALLVAVFFQRDGVGLNGGYVVNGFASLFKILFIISAIVSTWIALKEQEVSAEPVRETMALPWFILAGMGLMASAQDFLMLFVAIELVTITFYVLVSLRRKETASLEAGIKYLVMGALSTGFLVYGMAMIYGGVGTLNFAEIGKSIAQAGGLTTDNQALLLGIMMLLAGVGFKISVVPFHWWAPDVYQGAPTSVTTFLSVGSKVAGFAVLINLLRDSGPLNAVVTQHGTLLSYLAAASILFGSLGGLAQRDLKRLVGYSGISNAGFILLALCSAGSQGLMAAMYYIFAYSLAALLLFLAVGHIAVKTDKSAVSLADISGLVNKNVTIGWMLVISVASLAGIPPLAGFWAKWFVLGAAWSSGFVIPVIVAVVGAVAALVYYFGIIRSVFFEGLSSALDKTPTLGMSLLYRLGVSAIMAASVVIGLTPNVFIDILGKVFSQS